MEFSTQRNTTAVSKGKAQNTNEFQASNNNENKPKTE